MILIAMEVFFVFCIIHFVVQSIVYGIVLIMSLTNVDFEYWLYDHQLFVILAELLLIFMNLYFSVEAVKLYG